MDWMECFSVYFLVVVTVLLDGWNGMAWNGMDGMESDMIGLYQMGWDGMGWDGVEWMECLSAYFLVVVIVLVLLDGWNGTEWMGWNRLDRITLD